MNSIRFLGFLSAMASIASAAEAGALEQSTVRNIQFGMTTKFSDLSSFDAQEVCILQPYQDRLHSKDALAVRVNQHLAAKNYTADEGHFSVLIGKEAIEIATFKRSQQLDLLAKHEVASSVDEVMPKGFVPNDCVDGKFAALFKTEFRDRTYVVLGDAR
ncbi:hypothetical protein ACDY96_17585 [Rhizobium mongolense]|uniref:hypothetical protein n=1 Tax=Rhizobium mongolense TaxID=57676 RepID=UPI003558D05B